MQRRIRKACSFCRKRKLGCNMETPTCGSCRRHHVECVYEAPQAMNKKAVLKSVKDVRERMSRLEQLLLSQADTDDEKRVSDSVESPDHSDDAEPRRSLPLNDEMIAKLEEAYFSKVHLSVPILHYQRYHEALRAQQSGSTARATIPLFLRQAMWALAAFVLRDLDEIKVQAYMSARKALEDIELKDEGMNQVKLANAQAWILLSNYEMVHGYFHRCSMSIHRAATLVQMMGLERVTSTPYTSCLLPPPVDWTEAEERRRLFWHIFCLDRYICITLSLPNSMIESDIEIPLPASEQAYQSSTEEETLFLHDVCNSVAFDIAQSSPLAITAAMSTWCSSRLKEIYNIASTQPIDGFEANDRYLCSLLNANIGIPSRLEVSPRSMNPELIQINVLAPTISIIISRTLLQTRAIKTNPTMVYPLIKKKCMEAAESIASTLRLIAHLDLRTLHIYTPYAISAAMSVYGDLIKANQGDIHEKGATLNFLLNFLAQYTENHPLATILLNDFNDEFPEMAEKVMAIDANQARNGFYPGLAEVGQVPKHSLRASCVYDATDPPADPIHTLGSELGLLDADVIIGGPEMISHDDWAEDLMLPSSVDDFLVWELEEGET